MPAPSGCTHQARTNPHCRLSGKRRNRRDVGGCVGSSARLYPRQSIAAHLIQHRRSRAGTARYPAGRSAARSAHFRSSPRERTQGTPLSAMARDGGRTPKSAQCHARRNYQPSFSQSPRRTDDQIRCSASPAAFRRAGTDSSTYHRRQAHPSAYLSTQRCRSPSTCLAVDLVTISHWLGHASVETTNRYAAVDLETKRKALERAGPVAGTAESSMTTWRTDSSVLEWLQSL